MAYLLDADVFITAKNLHYGLDFCPGFWEWLTVGHGAGTLASVEKVGDEIDAGGDELSDWARDLPDGFFQKPDATTITALARVGTWVTSNGYEPAAVTTFLSIGDSYLVAQALAGGHTVVTHERPSDSTKRVKIPNVCLGLGVRVMTPFEMLRLERARFVMEERI